MTVKELIEKLSAFEGDMEIVFTRFNDDSEFACEYYEEKYEISDIEVRDTEYDTEYGSKVEPFVKVDLTQV